MVLDCGKCFESRVLFQTPLTSRACTSDPLAITQTHLVNESREKTFAHDRHAKNATH